MSTVSSDPETGSDPANVADAPAAPVTPPRRRRRLALWVSLGVGVIVAILIAVLATSGQAGEQLTDSPLLGKPAPELHGTALLNGPPGGGPVRLSSYRGRWVLVNFAASWCVPCQEEMPQLLLFAHQHASGDATILTVQFDQSDGTNLKRFLQARSVGWPALDDAAAPVDWGVGALPDSFVVDPQGVVVAEVEGQANATDLDALIKKYTAEAGS